MMIFWFVVLPILVCMFLSLCLGSFGPGAPDELGGNPQAAEDKKRRVVRHKEVAAGATVDACLADEPGPAFEMLADYPTASAAESEAEARAVLQAEGLSGLQAGIPQVDDSSAIPTRQPKVRRGAWGFSGFESTSA